MGFGETHSMKGLPGANWSWMKKSQKSRRGLHYVAEGLLCVGFDMINDEDDEDRVRMHAKTVAASLC